MEMHLLNCSNKFIVTRNYSTRVGYRSPNSCLYFHPLTVGIEVSISKFCLYFHPPTLGTGVSIYKSCLYFHPPTIRTGVSISKFLFVFPSTHYSDWSIDLQILVYISIHPLFGLEYRSPNSCVHFHPPTVGTGVSISKFLCTFPSPYCWDWSIDLQILVCISIPLLLEPGYRSPNSCLHFHPPTVGTGVSISKFLFAFPSPYCWNRSIDLQILVCISIPLLLGLEYRSPNSCLHFHSLTVGTGASIQFLFTFPFPYCWDWSIDLQILVCISTPQLLGLEFSYSLSVVP
jgi:hypothetical protein